MSEPGKVAIVTRAFNRLEYTTQCVGRVRERTTYPNYEHIVINQASSDGTRQWLDWITSMENGWFSHVRPIHNDHNSGDWGGMRDSLSHIVDAEYIVQLDNDILVPSCWLTAMVDVLGRTGGAAVMLKRSGVQQVMPVTGSHEWGSLHGGVVPRSVACYICRSERFRKVASNIRSCDHLGNAIGRPVYKIENLGCHQIEGFDGPQSYVQHEKYGPSEKHQVL